MGTRGDIKSCNVKGAVMSGEMRCGVEWEGSDASSGQRGEYCEVKCGGVIPHCET